ncbi:MAG: SEL1-like repeat protein, partial [Pseudomonadota bacterium]
RGYASGMGQVASMYMRGNGVAPDYVRARELFDKAYALGDPGSALRIGEMYQAGLGVPADPVQAAAWYRRSINLGNAFAATQLARLYEKGASGVEKDLDRAVALYEDAAHAGELSAQLRLARIYFQGIGRAPDHDKALEVLRAAAGAGMPTGQKALGQFYERQGQIEPAVLWYEKAEAGGDPWAPLYLGRLYLDNAELGPDPARAVALLQVALDRANGTAARDLAKIYESQVLGAPSQETALRYHRRAAEEGNIWSMRDLAKGLLKTGNAQDAAEGIWWMARSADGGHPWAQRDLGVRLATGDQVERDTQQAARYLGLAVASDERAAAGAARDALTTLLSDRERVRAAQTWLAQLGYDAGPVDGLAGSRTRAAVADFVADQGSAQLAPDSPDLMARLAPLVAGSGNQEVDLLPDDTGSSD